MEQIPCVHCGIFFTPRNKCQSWCGKPECQKARKADWQRNKLRIDPIYKESQVLSQQKWLQNNPGYWKAYRLGNPEKAERNKMMQKVRNRRQRVKTDAESETKPGLIAKMDARKSDKDRLSGYFWLVPVIAKMDATKIFIRRISGGCK
jgi:hypothetical protein